ncbi:indolethylamine N-methyltransferase-like [Mizuhopecten yessoensis]|uniref:indolethylamine N-methyltransferase-like n=1 Tax=Mizuhopecten yessoensis TaxID=6573 RepID=UPI000B45CFE1|nr:indolethylamine N-methyltransferase-like [Mizuhopecten yessoensis]
MMSLTETTEYDNFDPECYMKTHDWSTSEEEEERSIFQFNVDSMHDLFNSGVIKGHTLLDIGTGPTIRTVVSASAHVHEIYLSDVSQRNRAVMTDWWKGNSMAEAELTDYVLKRENARHSIADRQEMIKAKIRGVLPIDVRSGHPLGKRDHPHQFDVITTCLCFESAAQTTEAYRQVVQNAASLLKVGGHLVVIGIFDTTHYEVGDFKFMSVSLSQEEIEQIYKTCGFRIIYITRKATGKSFAMHAVKTT